VGTGKAETRPKPGTLTGRYVSGRYANGMNGRTRSSTQVTNDQTSQIVIATGPATTSPVRKYVRMRLPMLWCTGPAEAPSGPEPSVTLIVPFGCPVGLEPSARAPVLRTIQNRPGCPPSANMG